MFNSPQISDLARLSCSTTLLAMANIIVPSARADMPMAQPAIERAASEIDANALVLGEPAHGGMGYGQAINGLAFQDPITSFAGWQYVVYYDAGRKMCLARRKLPIPTSPAGDWQIIRFSGYEFKTNDAHNVASVGVSPKDGSIHLAYDGHGQPTYIRSSRPGVATEPEKVEWNESLFEPQRNEIESNKPLKTISYPRFFNAPDGDLQFAYRVRGSGDGDLWMADYDAHTGKWLDSRRIDTGKGEWRESAKSPLRNSRNSYPNGFQYGADGKLHTTWTWREKGDGNHDISYAYSEDKGVTWKNNAGQIVARTAPGKDALAMGIASPGLVAVPVTIRQGMINNQAQAIDSKGRVHVIVSHATPESARVAGLPWPSQTTWGAVAALRYHHYFRENDGTWKQIELPWVAGGRGWLGFDAADNAYFVYIGRTGPFPTGDDSQIYFFGSLAVATATAKNNYSDWSVAYEEQGPFSSEFRVDEARLKNEGLLSMIAQRAAGDGVFSSALSVVDLKVRAAR